MSQPVSGIRIIVPVDPIDPSDPDDLEEQRGVETESLWADRVTADTFRIRNSPFFAFDLSSEDVIRAEKVGEEWHFREVVERGGHSTYRIYLSDDRALLDDDVQAACKPLALLGATCENANSRFFAVDVPPAANLEDIYALFEQGEADDLWEFEESHYEPTAASNS